MNKTILLCWLHNTVETGENESSASNDLNLSYIRSYVYKYVIIFQYFINIPQNVGFNNMISDYTYLRQFWLLRANFYLEEIRIKYKRKFA